MPCCAGGVASELEEDRIPCDGDTTPDAEAENTADCGEAARAAENEKAAETTIAASARLSVNPLNPRPATI